MKEVIFSICCPTRNRTIHLERLFRSLLEKTENLKRVEILFKIDEDDIISYAYLQNAIKRFASINKRIFVGPRKDCLNKDYFNYLQAQAKGEFSWIFGDDLIFIYNNWDAYLLEKINVFFKDKKDRIAYINIFDNTPLPPGVTYRYANFPLMSREGVNAIGYFMPPTIPSWSSDYLIHIPYRLVDRVILVDQYILAHVSTHGREVGEDESSKKQRDLYSIYNVKEVAANWEQVEAPLLIQKLKYVIAHRT